MVRDRAEVREGRPSQALILGSGASGRAAAALAESGQATVRFADGCDFVVASPGIRVMSELQFGCEALKRQGWKLLAVTGSKGKSSVVKLVADAINAAGGQAVACGNFGRPVSDVALAREGRESAEAATRWAVVEVSSFMLETTALAPDTFEAAVILNLQEDHLDRHGGVAVYHALKRRLLGFAKRGFEPGTWPADAATDALLRGSYFDNPILRANGRAAIALLRAAGVPDASVAAAFAAFAPLPHRMNRVAVVRGVTCVDDSKATSLAALAAGVAMCPPGGKVRLVAGGKPKGDDPRGVRPALTSRVQKVYLIGQCAEAFSAAWRGSVDCEICGTLERAVARAFDEATAGETLLLSPGAASFDQFKSFEERGEVFTRLVQKEEGRKR